MLHNDRETKLMVHDNSGKNVDIRRRDFLSGAAAFAMVGGAVPTAFCAEGEDWKAAFRSLGFDPDAPGLLVIYCA